jgi:hypothetical protein
MGVALLDTDGQLLGHLAVLHDEPHLEGWTEAQPRSCAARRHGACHSS